MELPHSDLGLSVGAHPFKNVFELFYVNSYKIKQKSEIVMYLANLVITSAVGP